jgi:hypothetical protein
MRWDWKENLVLGTPLHLPDLVLPDHVIIISIWSPSPHEISGVRLLGMGALYLPWMSLKQHIVESVLVFPVLQRRRSSTYYYIKEIVSSLSSRRYIISVRALLKEPKKILSRTIVIHHYAVY